MPLKINEVNVLISN